MTMTNNGIEHRSPQVDTVKKIIIIGTGFAGLGMAIALKKNHIDDFVILEKQHDVGGVWRENTYPGAACDVPSHLYSFSFFLNPDWSRTFSPQSEIHAYLRQCARHFQLLPHIRFGCEVSAASYDELEQHWRVVLQNGEVLLSEIVVTAMGQLSRPVVPEMEGRESFQGPAFHSARWDHSIDLRGKRVAVIGTGASAIQFVPAIADQVGTMQVFQRTPNYILPRADSANSALKKKLFRRFPALMKLQRLAYYTQYESRALAFTRFKALMKLAVGLPFQRLLRTQLPDLVLRQKMTPDYQIGCKRILLSSDYLATFNRPNVQLVTDHIDRITPAGVQTKDGTVHAADVLIYGTGFAATKFLAPLTIKGAGGLDLNAVWSQGAKAYMGISVPDFPNFFMLYGPNTNLGHNSIVIMIESQIAHVMRCLKKMDITKKRVIEIDAAEYKKYTDTIQKDIGHTVWNGCNSWYVDAQGYNSTSWPGFTITYRWITRMRSLDVYRFS
ncbi:cation diffusion facilitator CzcD-associated flavoprotein CzcO [Oxalobacteraceae bacterium GrIS 2.11]